MQPLRPSAKSLAAPDSAIRIEPAALAASGLPRALLVNSTIALEGVVSFLSTLPATELERCSLGCYDWDPFARVLSFPVLMVRQDVEGLLGAAFEIIDRGTYAEPRVIEIRPELMFS
jgi:LacI family fructose operon transcriptional repressor